MLLRHAWLAPLLKPPTISEDEEAEKAAEAGDSMGTGGALDDRPSTADREVAEWVKAALAKKAEGKMTFAKKPALHEAPLDAVPGSPLMSKEDAPSHVGEPAADEGKIKSNPGVRVDSPELISAQIEPVDFASNVESRPDDGPT